MSLTKSGHSKANQVPMAHDKVATGPLVDSCTHALAAYILFLGKARKENISPNKMNKYIITTKQILDSVVVRRPYSPLDNLCSIPILAE